MFNTGPIQLAIADTFPLFNTRLDLVLFAITVFQHSLSFGVFSSTDGQIVICIRESCVYFYFMFLPIDQIKNSLHILPNEL